MHEVEHQKARSDKGADLVVIYSTNTVGHPLIGVEEVERKMLIQVKSYKGEHDVDGAMHDLQKAFEHDQHRDAHVGLIFTTGTVSDDFKEKLVSCNADGYFGKHPDDSAPRTVHVIDGQNVAGSC